MYSLKTIYKTFCTETAKVESILIKYSSLPKDFERDLIIESCFLRFVIIWEVFIEEYFLSAFCGAKTYSDIIIKPKVSKSPNKDEAFKRISSGRTDREKEFIDWLDYKKLKQKCIDFFHHKSRIHKVYYDANVVGQLQTIRNYIAHRSILAKKKFYEKVIRSHGYLPNPSPNAADFLIVIKRGTTIKYYEFYFNHFKDIAKELVK
jgi:hypothetical protein